MKAHHLAIAGLLTVVSCSSLREWWDEPVAPKQEATGLPQAETSTETSPPGQPTPSPSSGAPGASSGQTPVATPGGGVYTPPAMPPPEPVVVTLPDGSTATLILPSPATAPPPTTKGEAVVEAVGQTAGAVFGPLGYLAVSVLGTALGAFASRKRAA